MLAAASADPLYDEPWQRLAELRLARWRQAPRDETRAAFEEAQARAVQLNPRSAASWFAAGQRYRQVFDSGGVTADLDHVVGALREATRLDPTYAHYRAHLALALDAAGEKAEAARESSQARKLDQATPHADRKLEGELRDRLKRMPNGSN